MNWLIKLLGLPLLKYVIDKLVDALKEYIERKMLEEKIKKQTKAKIKEIRKEPDAKERSKRLRDMLNN